MKQFLTTIILIILFSAQIECQPVRQAGLRSGYCSGMFFQISDQAGNAEVGYAAILGMNRGLQLTGLRVIYQANLPEISPDLFIAWGYGGHAGFIWTDHYGFFGENYYFERYRACPVFGADGWIAAEYRFKEIPVNISLNLKPFVELTIPSFVRIIPWDIGISFSYVF